MGVCWYFFVFSSRRRHTRCALVTGVQRVLFRSQRTGPIWATTQTRNAPASRLTITDNQKRARYAVNRYEKLLCSRIAASCMCPWINVTIDDTLEIKNNDPPAIFSHE